ncbi:mercuric reductase [Nitrosomonas cryotolerans]|uniref:Mercuric reductase n=1 Tax=Nitrosomonas cryotolerans ATCC 49181 TaxID=1131553 RepID=A0A1N6HFC6_9PROT|nr:mercury(II) reductase [Nitrosomonas cryotolerans]SFQ06612.1 mercuric reductase [Nitrosomonas cryotolerans]SIO18456.1 mercuric reductase [Nitrosomonas cryotolerans ATCC 49181]
MSDCCSTEVSDISETKKMTQPDLLVIGGGSGGFSAAITAAESGANVVIAGHGTIGGTCVNVGCVPSKTMIRAMEAVHHAKDAARFDGIKGTSEIFNWKALVAQKQSLVDELRKAKYEDVLPSYPNITYVNMEDKARFTGNRTEVDIDGVLYHPKKIVIATGSSSALPPINGIQSVPVLDSTSALELEALPKSLLVIGGGVIGVELGQMFARAGVKVTICCRSRLLPEAEPEVSRALAGYLRAEGVTVCDGVRYQKIEKTTKGIKLVCETRAGLDAIEAEQLLVATGRRPNTDALDADKAGIKLLKNGGIEINEFMQSSNPDIYATGDVTGNDMFVYMAAYGGKLAAKNALDGNGHKYNNAAMPSVVFSDPQTAMVGLTETQARTQGHEVKTSIITLDHVPRYIAARDVRGLIKLVADRETDKLLGANILAPDGGELVQTMVLALKMGMTTADLANTIFPYLTGVEGLKLAAQTFDKDVNTLSCCAG